MRGKASERTMPWAESGKARTKGMSPALSESERSFEKHEQHRRQLLVLFPAEKNKENYFINSIS